MAIDPFTRTLAGSVWDRPAIAGDGRSAHAGYSGSRDSGGASGGVPGGASVGDTRDSAGTPFANQPASGTAAGASVEDEDISFADLLDVINPLQHIPVVGTIYRELTGDQIKPPARIFGGALYGGPLGAASAMVNVAIELETGRDIGGHLLALVTGADAPTTPDGQPADLALAAVPTDMTPEAAPATGASSGIGPAGAGPMQAGGGHTLSLAAAFASLESPALAAKPTESPRPASMARYTAIAAGPVDAPQTVARADTSSEPAARPAANAGVGGRPGGSMMPRARAGTTLTPARQPTWAAASAAPSHAMTPPIVTASASGRPPAPQVAQATTTAVAAPVHAAAPPTTLKPIRTAATARMADDTTNGIHPVAPDRVAEIMARNMEKYRQALNTQRKKEPTI